MKHDKYNLPNKIIIFIGAMMCMANTGIAGQAENASVAPEIKCVSSKDIAKQKLLLAGPVDYMYTLKMAGKQVCDDGQECTGCGECLPAS